MAGSPLKRNFTAAIEGGDGFTYLKKRRLDDNEVLSGVAGGSLRLALEQPSGNDPVWCSRVLDHSALGNCEFRRNGLLRKPRNRLPQSRTLLPRRVMTVKVPPPNASHFRLLSITTRHHRRPTLFSKPYRTRSCFDCVSALPCTKCERTRSTSHSRNCTSNRSHHRHRPKRQWRMLLRSSGEKHKKSPLVNPVHQYRNSFLHLCYDRRRTAVA